MFQWLFDQYLVAPLPYGLRGAKKGDATPKGRTLRLDLSGGFDSATLARRVKTPHAALFDSAQKVGAGSAEGRLRRRRSSLARVIQGASKAQLELNLDDEADRIGPRVAYCAEIKYSTRLQCRPDSLAVLRELNESNRFVQKSAESTSI